MHFLVYIQAKLFSAEGQIMIYPYTDIICCKQRLLAMCGRVPTFLRWHEPRGARETLSHVMLLIYIVFSSGHSLPSSSIFRGADHALI